MKALIYLLPCQHVAWKNYTFLYPIKDMYLKQNFLNMFHSQPLFTLEILHDPKYIGI